MEWNPVESTSIKSIGYKNGILYVEFKESGKGIYRYLNVPIETYQELINSDSKGSYLNRKIRTKYKYERIQ